MSGAVHCESAGGVARVTLAHAGKFNAMSRAMWLRLRELFESLQRDAGLRCVIVAGEAGHFCAGGDISEYADFRFDEAALRHFHETEVWGALRALLDCDLPLIAAIDGNCMGAGLEIASCCDLRVAAPDARFGAPIARLGFPMAPREAALVLRAVGEATTREMLLTAAVLDADEMKRRGFLHEVAPASAAAEALAQRMLALAPAAARLNKQALRALADARDAPALASLDGAAYAYADSAEHREGIAAFVAKRRPKFAS